MIKISISSGAFFLLLYFFSMYDMRISRIPWSLVRVFRPLAVSVWDGMMGYGSSNNPNYSRSASKSAFTTSPPSPRFETKTEKKRRQACSNCCAMIVVISVLFLGAMYIIRVEEELDLFCLLFFCCTASSTTNRNSTAVRTS